eukprot:jgi/Psemu1/25715/gm1.25715_g
MGIAPSSNRGSNYSTLKEQTTRLLQLLGLGLMLKIFGLGLGHLLQTQQQEQQEQTNEKSNDSDDEPPSTFYKMNDITLDHALHGDPGSIAVTERIVEYLDEASFADPALIDLDDSGGEFPVCDIIAPATADGSPTKRWLDFQTADIESADGVFEDRRYKRPRVFFAGFHFMMEFLTMRGKLTRDFTSYLARRWRPKEPALNWIYMIWDPDDALHEWREYLLMHYKATSESCGSTNEQFFFI